MKTERELRPAALAAVKAIVDGQAATWGQVATIMQYVDSASDRIMILETNQALMAYMAKQGEKENVKMQKDEVAAKIKEIILKIQGPELESKIVPGANLEADLGFDSLDKMEFVMDLEDEIDGDISDEEACKLKTVGDVQAFLENAVG